MDCQDAGIRLKDLVAGRLAPAEREAIEQHLRRCPACAAAAVSLAHPAGERALWEHAGRAATRHLKRARPFPDPPAPASPPAARPPIVLRRARGSEKERLSVPIRIRLLQAAVIGLTAAIAVLLGAHFGNWNDFLGLERWAPPRASSASHAIVGRAAAVPDEPTVFRHASRTLAEIAVVADDPELSNRIRSSGVVARLHAARQRSSVPAWIRSAAAPVEAVLVRAEAAGSDVEEWRMVRSYVVTYDLARVCEDLDASTRLLFEGNGP